MTRRISLVAVCCSRVSVRSRLRVSSSLNRRTFSMAMTAWSAKVWRSSTWLSVKGPAPGRQTTIDADRLAVSQHRDGQEAPEADGHGRVAERVRRDRPGRRATWTTVPVEDRASGHHGCAVRSAIGERCAGSPSCRPASSCEWPPRWSSSPSRRADALWPPSHRRRRSRAMMSKTGWTSVGELDDDAQDLAGGGLLLQRLGEVAVAASSSLNRRTFSMAMTAWSAKVLRSSTCSSREGPGLARADGDRPDRRCRPAASGRASDAPEARGPWPVAWSAYVRDPRGRRGCGRRRG